MKYDVYTLVNNIQPLVVTVYDGIAVIIWLLRLPEGTLFSGGFQETRHFDGILFSALYFVTGNLCRVFKNASILIIIVLLAC